MIDCDSVICELLCVAGVRVGRSVRLQPGLGRDPLSEGHSERRVQLPGGVQAPQTAERRPVPGHLQEVSVVTERHAD